VIVFIVSFSYELFRALKLNLYKVLSERERERERERESFNNFITLSFKMVCKKPYSFSFSTHNCAQERLARKNLSCINGMKSSKNIEGKV
jgi:hypothetical protein